MGKLMMDKRNRDIVMGQIVMSKMNEECSVTEASSIPPLGDGVALSGRNGDSLMVG